MFSREPPYLIDLHVHTRTYSPCAELLDPLCLDEAMSRREIQGVVLTEHDVIWPEDEINRLRHRLTDGHRIYRGIEVSCREGHFVVIGIDNDDRLEAGMPLSTLLELAHSVEAVVIWAHPFRPSRVIDTCLDPAFVPDTMDAVEVYSTVTRGEGASRALELAAQRAWRAVAGSDAHAIENVGEAVTGFAELPKDEAALAFAIRRGQVLAMRLPHLNRER